MITADWVAIGLVALFLLLGFLVGFGKGLKFFTSGVFGFIISVVVCYFFGGLIYRWQLVQDLMNKLIEAMTDVNGFCDFLLSIHIDVIIYYVGLFIIVSIIRLIIVVLIKGIAEAPGGVMKIINKTLGMVLFLSALVILTLLIFHLIALIGGGTAEGFAESLAGSLFGLDKLFEQDILMTIINGTN